jgi:hypothetical protein
LLRNIYVIIIASIFSLEMYVKMSYDAFVANMGINRCYNKNLKFVKSCRLYSNVHRHLFSLIVDLSFSRAAILRRNRIFKERPLYFLGGCRKFYGNSKKSALNSNLKFNYKMGESLSPVLDRHRPFCRHIVQSQIKRFKY